MLNQNSTPASQTPFNTFARRFLKLSWEQAFAWCLGLNILSGAVGMLMPHALLPLDMLAIHVASKWQGAELSNGLSYQYCLFLFVLLFTLTVLVEAVPLKYIKKLSWKNALTVTFPVNLATYLLGAIFLYRLLQ